MSRYYDEYKSILQVELAEVPMVAITLDGWTSPYQTSFLAVTAHWINDIWVQQDIIIGFEHLKGSHTSEALLEVFLKVIERFTLQQKVMSITSDNGSNMIKLAKDFENHTRLNPNVW